MALDELIDLTGQNIQDTYQKVVQTDGTTLADGTGSLLPISFRDNDVVISGSLIAQTYVVSESIVNISSGSTAFGNTAANEDFIFVLLLVVTCSTKLKCDSVFSTGDILLYSNNLYIDA